MYFRLKLDFGCKISTFDSLNESRRWGESKTVLVLSVTAIVRTSSFLAQNDKKTILGQKWTCSLNNFITFALTDKTNTVLDSPDRRLSVKLWNIRASQWPACRRSRALLGTLGMITLGMMKIEEKNLHPKSNFRRKYNFAKWLCTSSKYFSISNFFCRRLKYVKIHQISFGPERIFKN